MKRIPILIMSLISSLGLSAQDNYDAVPNTAVAGQTFAPTVYEFGNDINQEIHSIHLLEHGQYLPGSYFGKGHTVEGTITSINSPSHFDATFNIPGNFRTGEYDLITEKKYVFGTYNYLLNVYENNLIYIDGSHLIGTTDTVQAGSAAVVTVNGVNTTFGAGPASPTTGWLQGESTFGNNGVSIPGSFTTQNATTGSLAIIIPQNALTGYWDLMTGKVSGYIEHLSTEFGPELVYVENGKQLLSINPNHAYIGQSHLATVEGQFTNFTQGYYNFSIRKSMLQSNNSALITTATYTTTTSSTSFDAYFDFASNLADGFYDVFVSNYWDVYLELVESFVMNNNLGGTGNINGTVTNLGGNKTSEGNIEDFGMYLIENSSDTIQYALMDEYGDFSFQHIPNGTYELFIEGTDNNNAAVIVLDETNPSNEGGDYLITDSGLVLVTSELQTSSSAASVFPNPANEMINLNFEMEKSGPVIVNFIDIHGRQIMNVNMKGNAGANSLQVVTSLLSPGTYFMMTNFDGQRSVNKVIKTQ